MAERRMISKVISVSEKVNTLPEIFDMLLFTWMIPHADDFGRLAGSAAKVKALVVPMLPVSIAQVKQSLENLQDNHLIYWFEAEGEQVIEIVNFDQHQTGLHKRTKSKLPAYSEKFPEIPGSSENFPKVPLELNRTEQKGIEEEQNRIEGNGTEQNPHRDFILSLINQLKITDANLYRLDQIYSYIGAVDIEVIEHALKQAEGKHVNYAITVLDSLIKKGKTTKESVAIQKPQHKGKPKLKVVPKQEVEPDISDDEFEQIRLKALRLEEKSRARA